MNCSSSIKLEPVNDVRIEHFAGLTKLSCSPAIQQEIELKVEPLENKTESIRVVSSGFDLKDLLSQNATPVLSIQVARSPRKIKRSSSSYIQVKKPPSPEPQILPTVPKPNARIRCELCGFKIRADAMQNHKHRQHFIDRPFECELCGLKFRACVFLKQHINRFHPKNVTHNKQLQHACDVCYFFTKEPSVLKRHIQQNHTYDRVAKLARARFECFCGFASSSAARLHVHRQKMHNDTRSFNCHKCGKSFKMKTHLTEHLRAHDGDIKCERCNQTFWLKCTLRLHQLKPCAEYKPFYKCGKCDKVFKFRPNYLRHLGSGFHEKYKCALCESAFMKAADLRRHTFQEHKAMNINFDHKCPICSLVLPTLKELTSHALIHNENGSQTRCPFCQTDYASFQTLYDHFQRKHRLKQICGVCGAEFWSVREMQRHGVKEHGKIGYVCDNCDKTFMIKNHLRRHLLTKCHVKSL